MNRVRLATKEEIESIKPVSDLDLGCTVMALNSQVGTGLAVRRICNEIDPLVAPEAWSTRLKSIFVRDLEHIMLGQGVTHYYFNVDATDKEWQEVVKSWGAEQVSQVPMLRFKVTLNVNSTESNINQ